MKRHSKDYSRPEIIPEPAWKELASSLLHRNETVLIIGAANSGKSTLTQYLLGRFLEINVPVALIDADYDIDTIWEHKRYNKRMIRNTFSMLHGIGKKLERRLWKNGILTWHDFLGASDVHFINPPKKQTFDNYLFHALKELSEGNAPYFAENLKRTEHWRLFDIFREKAACLDIETNGLSPESGGYITLIGIYDGFDYKCFIRDKSLTIDNVRRELSRYKYLITFYGSAFDIPFMKRSLPDLTFNVPHFDICFGARKLGIRRGLKTLEKDLGIERDKSVRGMNGYDAVRFWEYSKGGSSEALDLLITYNREDTVNLFQIADIVYQRLRAQTGIDEYL